MATLAMVPAVGTGDAGQSSQQAPPPEDAGNSILLCRSPCFSFSLCFPLAEFKYITNSAYIYVQTRLYMLKISKLCLCLNVFRLVYLNSPIFVQILHPS
jgi:hypothetical protein